MSVSRWMEPWCCLSSACSCPTRPSRLEIISHLCAPTCTGSPGDVAQAPSAHRAALHARVAHVALSRPFCMHGCIMQILSPGARQGSFHPVGECMPSCTCPGQRLPAQASCPEPLTHAAPKTIPFSCKAVSRSEVSVFLILLFLCH